MKKFLALALALIASASFCAFAGCNGGNDESSNANEGSAKSGEVVLDVQSVVFTAKEDYITLTDSTSVADYMNALKSNGELVFEGTTGDYGLMITSVYGKGGKTITSTANSYAGYDWAFYTTITEIDGVPYSSDYQTFKYNDLTLYKASYGVSGVPCVACETYALVYEYSEFSW